MPTLAQVRLAVAQIELIDGDRDANVRRMLALAERVGPDHDVLLLPETCTSGFASPDDVERLAEPIDGPTITALTDIARRHDLLIVTGLAERATDGLYNASVVVDADGPRLVYRKTHLWLADRDVFLPGDRLVTTDWRGVRIAPLICFDVEFPETARAVAALGARLVLVSDGNMDPYGPVHRVAAMARAQENQVFVAMANRTGPGRFDMFSGGSLVAAPDGRLLAEAGTEDTVLSVTLDLSELATARRVYDYLVLRRVALSLEGENAIRGLPSVHIPPL